MQSTLTLDAEKSIDLSSVELTWTDSFQPGPARRYLVERKAAGEPRFRKLAAVSGYEYTDATVENDGTYQYRVRSLRAGIKSEIETRLIAFSTYQGGDPILKPPLPPDFYMATVHPIQGQQPPDDPQPRVTWTAPEVEIRFDPEDIGDPDAGSPTTTITFQMYVDNYLWPTWSESETYILNQTATRSGTRYRSLSDDNFGNDPASSPNSWRVDDTVFSLYLKTTNRVTQETYDFALLCDTTGVVSAGLDGNPAVDSGFVPHGYNIAGAFFNIAEGQRPYCPVGLNRKTPAQRYDLYFQCTASANGMTVFSPIRQFVFDL